MKGLEEVERLKRVHRRWALADAVFGALPLFAGFNKVHPVLTDGYGGDLLPALLPEAMARNYNSILAGMLALLVGSELLRRRFHKRHERDLNL
jgi:hypothetical protein